MEKRRDVGFHQEYMEATSTEIYGEILAQVEKSMPISKVDYDYLAYRTSVEDRHEFLNPINNEEHRSDIRSSD